MITTKEPISKNYISSLIPACSMILDVGSFDGADAVELSNACASHVHCFEPYPASFELMKLQRHPGLTLWQYALGGYNGRVPMFIARGHVQSNSIRMPKVHKKIWPEIKFRGKVEIQIRMLDDWFRSWQVHEPWRKHIDLVWLDVNGAEADFLIGAAKTLQVTKYIYIEYCEKELYHNAMNREATIKALPGFEVIGDYGFKQNFGNLLFHNKNIQL